MEQIKPKKQFMCEVCDQWSDFEPTSGCTYMCEVCDGIGFCEACVQPGGHDCVEQKGLIS